MRASHRAKAAVLMKPVRDLDASACAAPLDTWRTRLDFARHGIQATGWFRIESADVNVRNWNIRRKRRVFQGLGRDWRQRGNAHGNGSRSPVFGRALKRSG